MDKDSSSGSYYPYSAGTVGDDPSEPTSTSAPADAGDSDSGPTDQWSDAADTDGDGYLSTAVTEPHDSRGPCVCKATQPPPTEYRQMTHINSYVAALAAALLLSTGCNRAESPREVAKDVAEAERQRSPGS